MVIVFYHRDIRLSMRHAVPFFDIHVTKNSRGPLALSLTDCIWIVPGTFDPDA